MQNPTLPPIDVAALKEVISGEARKMRHLQNAEKVLLDLDRITQHIAEKNAELDKLKNVAAEAQATKEAANAFASDLRKQALQEKSAADSQKAEMLAQAEKAAEKIKADARAEAKEAVDAAEKIVAGHNEKAEALTEKIVNLAKEHEAKKGELDALEKKLADHKASLAAFLK